VPAFFYIGEKEYIDGNEALWIVSHLMEIGNNLILNLNSINEFSTRNNRGLTGNGID
jgi:hypothetical protein